MVDTATSLSVVAVHRSVPEGSLVMNPVMNAVLRAAIRFPIVVIGVWTLLAGFANLAVPQLEQVIGQQSRAFFPSDADASMAAARMGAVFGDSDSNNVTYVVLEGGDALGEPARAYYRSLVAALRGDPGVESLMDLWSDPVTAPIAESRDHRAAYLLLRLSGDLGSAEAARSVQAVRAAVEAVPPPPDVTAYVTGPGATIYDEFASFDRQMLLITAVTVVLIAALLLAVYRSLVAAAIPLMTVGLSLAVARPLVAFLGIHGVVEVSVFSTALISAMILGAGTDYGIFLVGRYHENRRAGIDHRDALIGAYRSVAPVIAASAVTIAAALCCLSFAKVGMLRSAGIPCAIGIVVALAASLTLLPALCAVTGRFGLIEPKPSRITRRWRRVGVVVARWPGPVLVAAGAVLVVCAVPLLGLTIGYSEVAVQPSSTESNRGYQAAQRHFPSERLLPETVLIEADHDLRTPQGLIAVERISRRIMEIPGVRGVQSASRPAGGVQPESTLTDQAGRIGSQLRTQSTSIEPQLDSIRSMRTTLDSLSAAVGQLQTGLSGGVRGLGQIGQGGTDLRAGVQVVRDNSDTLAGYLDPLRDFIANTPNCDTHPICGPVQRIVTPIDAMMSGTGQLADATAKFDSGAADAGRSLAGATDAVATMRATVANLRRLVDALTGTLDGLLPQLRQMTDYLTGIGSDFAGTGEGGFYLPSSALDDPRFQRVLQLLFSPDGHATRLLVYGDGGSWGRAGATRADQIKLAVTEATKEGSVVDVGVHVTGVGSATADVHRFLLYDFRLLATAAMVLIFLVVAVMLRSPVAATVVLATVAVSYASALGVSHLLWRYVFGHELHWAVPSMAFIALVAVGADYNLLLAARLREEANVGQRTAIIRAFAGTGGVVTTAGLVFGLTMFAMFSADLITIAQVGSTIGIGLMIDTFVVRAAVVPSIAALLGRWFWWPHLRVAVTPRSRDSASRA
jgi:RND superfamily putative drug exporter